MKAEWNHSYWPPGIFIGSLFLLRLLVITFPSRDVFIQPHAKSRPGAREAFIRNHKPLFQAAKPIQLLKLGGPAKTPSARQVLLFVPSELCTLPLSNLHVDFELAEHSFILHWLCLQVPPFLLKQWARGAALLSGEVGERVRGMPATSLSVLATSSNVQLMQSCSPKGQLARWSHAALYLFLAKQVIWKKPLKQQGKLYHFGLKSWELDLDVPLKGGQIKMVNGLKYVSQHKLI